jgi:hypothetical protein
MARTCAGGEKVETTVLGARPKQLHPEDSLLAAMADSAGMLIRFSSVNPGCARLLVRSLVYSTLETRSSRRTRVGPAGHGTPMPTVTVEVVTVLVARSTR